MGSSDATVRARAHSLRDQADGSVGATQADGNSIDIDAEAAKLAANALEQQAAVSVAQDPQRDPPLRAWVSADEHVRRHGDLRDARSPRSACG